MLTGMRVSLWEVRRAPCLSFDQLTVGAGVTVSVLR